MPNNATAPSGPPPKPAPSERVPSDCISLPPPPPKALYDEVPPAAWTRAGARTPVVLPAAQPAATDVHPKLYRPDLDPKTALSGPRDQDSGEIK